MPPLKHPPATKQEKPAVPSPVSTTTVPTPGSGGASVGGIAPTRATKIAVPSGPAAKPPAVHKTPVPTSTSATPKQAVSSITKSTPATAKPPTAAPAITPVSTTAPALPKDKTTAPNVEKPSTAPTKSGNGPVVRELDLHAFEPGSHPHLTAGWIWLSTLQCYVNNYIVDGLMQLGVFICVLLRFFFFFEINKMDSLLEKYSTMSKVY